MIIDPMIEVRKSLIDLNKSMEQHLSKIVSEIQFPNPFKEIEMTFPKFEFPELNIPELDIDHIEEITKNNSKYGWTLTNDISIFFYLNKGLINLSQKEIDFEFYSYYMDNNSSNYYVLKDSILEKISSKWRCLANESFSSFENNNFRVIIPTLITIIEGEICEISKSNLYGRKLVSEWKGTISYDDKIISIAAFSLHRFLDKNLFKVVDFKSSRPQALNRNWILHGRDTPELWTEKDALKLFNVLSTFQLIKDLD